MSSEQNKKAPEKKQGLVGGCCWIIVKLITWTLLGGCMALVISVLLLLLLGHQTAIEYVNSLLQGQLRYLGIYMGHSFLVHNPVNFVVTFSRQIYQWLFIDTGLINFFNQNINQLHHLQLGSDKSINQNVSQFVGSAYPILSDYGRILITTVELMSVKLAVVVLAIPCFLLLAIAGFVDGLVQRDLRKFGGGRESALIYHRAKAVIIPVFFIGCLFYLVLPFDIAPEFIFLPCALIVGYSIAVMTSMFKKYV